MRVVWDVGEYQTASLSWVWLFAFLLVSYLPEQLAMAASLMDLAWNLRLSIPAMLRDLVQNT